VREQFWHDSELCLKINAIHVCSYLVTKLLGSLYMPTAQLNRHGLTWSLQIATHDVKSFLQVSKLQHTKWLECFMTVDISTPFNGIYKLFCVPFSTVTSAIVLCIAQLEARYSTPIKALQLWSHQSLHVSSDIIYSTTPQITILHIYNSDTCIFLLLMSHVA